jgi:hypothetical protein
VQQKNKTQISARKGLSRGRAAVKRKISQRENAKFTELST